CSEPEAKETGRVRNGTEPAERKKRSRSLHPRRRAHRRRPTGFLEPDSGKSSPFPKTFPSRNPHRRIPMIWIASARSGVSPPRNRRLLSALSGVASGRRHAGPGPLPAFKLQVQHEIIIDLIRSPFEKSRTIDPITEFERLQKLIGEDL